MDELYAREAPEASILTNNEICMIVVAVLVAKAGGSITMRQEDFNRVSGKLLSEDYDPETRELTLEIVDSPRRAS